MLHAPGWLTPLLLLLAGILPQASAQYRTIYSPPAPRMAPAPSTIVPSIIYPGNMPMSFTGPPGTGFLPLRPLSPGVPVTSNKVPPSQILPPSFGLGVGFPVIPFFPLGGSYFFPSSRTVFEPAPPVSLYRTIGPYQSPLIYRP